ncbi:MAG: hypothetical protein RLZZ387_5307 [Chloroflexota bacterium]|jgi:ribosomal protein S18 acetylase RimI-like enzyme
MTFAIRPYHPSDMVALYRICLLTGDSGQDASALYRDPELLGHVFAGPYAVFEPDLCFTLTHAAAPVGYVLATRDSAAFAERCEREWFPPLRERYPLPPPDDHSSEAGFTRYMHAGLGVSPEMDAYPAHLHIDILPVAQGQGWGRRLIETLAARLREVGVPGVHLGVGARNTRAIAFYERVGFHRIQTYDTWVAFGMRLS